MNKKHIFMIIAIIILFIICILVGFFNHDKIDKIINGENWNFIEAYHTINDIQPKDSFGESSFGVFTKNGFTLYKDKDKSVKEDYKSASNIHHSKGQYSVVFAKDINTLYIIKNGEIIYKNVIKQSPKFVFINKNGYTTLLYPQAGYKTGVKVISPDGADVLTTYLATSYALTAEISSNNKYLYLGAVDSSGIKIKSTIRIINIENKETKVVNVGLGEVITDIKCVNNGLFVQTDLSVYKVDLDTNVVSKIKSLDSSNIVSIYIDDFGSIVTIKNNISSGYTLEYERDEYKKEISLELVPQNVDIYGNTMVLNFGDEVWVVKNGVLKSKIAIEEALITINIIEGGNEVALIYRNKIELVKI